MKTEPRDMTTNRRTLLKAGAGAAMVGSSLGATAIVNSLAAQGDASSRIVIMTGTEAETLDPHLTGTRNTQIITEAIHSGLVKRDVSNTIAPDLATEWSISDDELSWTFTLRQDGMFSDGTPVHASDVKYSLDRILNPDNNSNYISQMSAVESVEVIDDFTVTIHTSTPFSALDEILSDPGPRILQEAAASAGALEDYGRNPVGSGAYMLESWTPGQSIELVPNPHYYGEAPKNAGLSMRFASEGGARTAALESGQVDLITALPPEAIDRIDQSEDLTVLVADSSFLIFFAIDHGSEPFSDQRVRLAANLAVDRQTIIDTILGGLGSVANSPFGPGVLNRVDLEPFPYDPEQAKQLLADAGYADGVPIVMWTPQGRYLKDRQVAEAVQGYLSEVGFKPELQVFEWGTYVTERQTDPPIADLWLIGASIPGAYWNLVNNYHTDSDYPNSYSNPEVDDLISQASQTFDLDEQSAIYAQIQEIVFEQDIVHLFLHGQKQVLGYKTGLTGIEPLPYEIFYPETITFEE